MKILLFFIKGIAATIILAILTISIFLIYVNVSIEIRNNTIRTACEQKYSLKIQEKYSITNDDSIFFKLKETSPLVAMYRDYNNGNIFGRQDSNQCLVTNEKPIIFEIYYKGALVDLAKFYVNVSYDLADQKRELDFTNIFFKSLDANLYTQKSDDFKQNEYKYDSKGYFSDKIRLDAGDSGLVFYAQKPFIPILKNRDSYGFIKNSLVFYSLGDNVYNDYTNVYISNGKLNFRPIHKMYNSLITPNKSYQFDNLIGRLKNSSESSKSGVQFVQDPNYLTIFKSTSDLNDYDTSLFQNICILKAEKCKNGYVQIDFYLNEDSNKYYLSDEYLELLKLKPFEFKD